MGKIQDLYDTRVRPMPPAERLQLARLIIDDLSPVETSIDVSDDWSADDLADLTTFAVRQAARPDDGAQGTP